VVSRKTGAEADRLLAANSIDDATADAEVAGTEPKPDDSTQSAASE